MSPSEGRQRPSSAASDTGWLPMSAPAPTLGNPSTGSESRLPQAPRTPSVHRLLAVARRAGYVLPWEPTPAAGTTVLRFTPTGTPTVDVRAIDGQYLLTVDGPLRREFILGYQGTPAAQVLWAIPPLLVAIAYETETAGDTDTAIRFAELGYRFASSLSAYEHAGDCARLLSVLALTKHEFATADAWVELAFTKYRLAGLGPESSTVSTADPDEDDISFT